MCKVIVLHFQCKLFDKFYSLAKTYHLFFKIIISIHNLRHGSSLQLSCLSTHAPLHLPGARVSFVYLHCSVQVFSPPPHVTLQLPRSQSHVAVTRTIKQKIKELNTTNSCSSRVYLHMLHHNHICQELECHSYIDSSRCNFFHHRRMSYYN